jgi:hypothetical protein
MIELAGVHGVEQVVVETNAKWTDAQALYEGVGFTLTHYAPGDFGREAFYKLDL